MSYDFCKLKGRIIEKFGNQYSFAKKMNWSARTCSLKMQGKVYWKQNEIAKACTLLSLADTDIQDYFFTLDVQQN
jgi:hypothetical protein